MFDFKKSFVVFVLFFAVTFLVGCFFHQQILEFFSPSVDKTINAIGYAMAAAPPHHPFLISLIFAGVIFLKNILVVAVILIFSFRLFTGFIPAVIVIVNGVVLGAVFMDLVASGLPWQEAAMYFVPHGIIEIPAVIGACVLAVSIKETKEKLRKGGKWIVPFLGVAALIEVYVTPLFLGIH